MEPVGWGGGGVGGGEGGGWMEDIDFKYRLTHAEMLIDGILDIFDTEMSSAANATISLDFIPTIYLPPPPPPPPPPSPLAPPTRRSLFLNDSRCV